MADNRYIQYPYNGQVRIKEVATTTSCDQRPTLTLDEWNALPLLSTLQTPANHTLETLSCPTGETEAVYVTPPPENGGGTGTDPASSNPSDEANAIYYISQSNDDGGIK